MDELAEWRRRRQERVDEAIRAAGLVPPARLSDELAVTLDPSADPNTIRFVAPDGTDAAVVRLKPELQMWQRQVLDQAFAVERLDPKRPRRDYYFDSPS